MFASTSKVLVGSALLASALTLVPINGALATDGPSVSRMVLLLDSSGSMKKEAQGDSRIEAARSALLNVIDELPVQASVGLRVFGSKVFERGDAGACEDTQLVVPVGTDNRTDLAAATKAYKPYGETPIPAALEGAAEDLGPTGQRSIVLVSDGESTCGDPCPIAKKISRSGVDLMINVVGLGVSGKARSQLECIADAGGGQYYDAQNASEIEATLEHVASRGARPFTISGTPIEGGSEGAPTDITAGDWADSFPARAKDRFYTFNRTSPTSTLRVSLYGQGYSDVVTTYSVTLTSEGCSRVTELTQRIFNTRSILGVQATYGPQANGCETAGPVTIKVSSAQGVEAESPFGLRIREDNEDIDPTSASEPAPAPAAGSVAGKPTEVIPGSGFESAHRIAPGSYAANIVPGEAQLFAFDLEYGQAAKLTVIPSPRSDALRKKTGAINVPLGRVALYSPTLRRDRVRTRIGVFPPTR